MNTIAEERRELTATIERLRKLRSSLIYRRLKDCQDRGLNARQAADELGVSRAYIYHAAWVRDIKLAPMPQSRRHPRYELVEIIPQATVRDTAVAYRGRASASQIAAAVGTTRNAIIGHWFRSRQSA